MCIRIITEIYWTPENNTLTNKGMDIVLEELYSWDSFRIYTNVGIVGGSINAIQRFIDYRDKHGMHDISQTGGKLVSY